MLHFNLILVSYWKVLLLLFFIPDDYDILFVIEKSNFLSVSHVI